MDSPQNECRVCLLHQVHEVGSKAIHNRQTHKTKEKYGRQPCVNFVWSGSKFDAATKTYISYCLLSSRVCGCQNVTVLTKAIDL